MRKTIKFLGLVAGMASLLVSCQKEKLVDTSSASSENVGYSVVTELDEETKTALECNSETGKYYYVWNETETLAVSEFTSTKNNDGGTSYSVQYKESNEGVSLGDGIMKFSVNFSSKQADSYVYYAVYPFKALDKQPSINNAGNITLSITLPEEQNPLTDSFDPAADILVSKPFKDKPNGGFAFSLNRHSVGIKLHVQNFATEFNGEPIHYKDIPEKNIIGERIEKVIITSSNSNISGKTTFSFENGKMPPLTPTRTGNSKKVSLDYSSMEDEDFNIGMAIDNAKGNDIYFTTWPFDVKDGSSLTIEIHTTGYVFEKTLTATEDKYMEFPRATVAKLKVNFDTDDVVITKNEVSDPVIPTGYYVVSLDKKALIAQQDNQFILSREIQEKSSTEGETPANNVLSLEKDDNGAYKIEDEESQIAVWKFEYNKVLGKYLISSVSDPDKYLKASPADKSLTLVSKDKATLFSIEENKKDRYYSVFAGGKYLGCNNRYLMNDAIGDNTKLSLTPAIVNAEIRVPETFEIPVAAGKYVIPVSLIDIDRKTVSVKSEQNWLTNFKLNGSGIEFNATEGNEEEDRTATITIAGKNNEGDKTITKTVTITQHHKLFYARILTTEIRDAYLASKWGAYDNYYLYSQPNGAEWGILCKYANIESQIAMQITVNSGYVKLPVFGQGISKVTVNLASKLTQTPRIIGLYSSAESNEPVAKVEVTAADIAAANKTYVIYVDDENANLTTAYLKSNTTLSITGIEVEARKMLKTPSNVKTEGKTLSWTEVANADSYYVTVGTDTAKVTTNSYDFTGADEYYDVTVIAKANPESTLYIDSAPYEAENLKFGAPKLNKPEKLTEAGATQTTLKVTWTADKRADGYVCTISSTELSHTESKTVTGNIVEFTGLTSGKQYTVTVYAIDSNKKYSDSEPSVTKIQTAAIELDGDGSVGNPYFVKDVKAFETSHILNLEGKYVKGTVSAVNKLEDGKLSYTITDGTNTLEVTGKDLGNAEFSSTDELPLKGVVIYYENNTDNYLYSIDGNTTVLKSIEVAEAQSKLTYGYGEAFAAPVVYAIYRGAESKMIADFKVSGSVDSQLENVTKSQTVTVAYSENDGISKPAEATYDITIIKYTYDFYDSNFTSGNVVIKTFKSAGIETTLTNFNRNAATYVIGKATECAIATTTAIPDAVNYITLSITQLNLADGTWDLVVTDINGNKVYTKNGIVLPQGNNKTAVINLGKTFENCKYSFKFNLPQANNAQRLRLSNIIFEKK